MKDFVDFDLLRELLGTRRATHNANPQPAARRFGDGCDGCQYRRPFAGNPNETACHYCVDTGHLRGCDPGANCLHKTPATPEKKNFFANFFKKLS